MPSNYDVDAILAKYGLGPAAEPERKPSLWQKVTQPVKTLFGATGGAIPGALLGETDLYKEAKQRELEQLAASRGVTPEDLTTAEKIEALPGLGAVLTSADAFDESTLGRVAKPVVRIAGDILGDPTSYLGGAGALSKIGAIRKIGAGADAARVLEAANLAGTSVGRLDKAFSTGKAVEAAGKALGEGKRFKAAWQGVKALAPQEPFGVLPAFAYGPELAGGIKESFGTAAEQFSQGEYGSAAEAATSGLGLTAMAGLIARGLHGDIKTAQSIAAKAQAPIKTGPEAVAAYSGPMPERLGMEGPEFAPPPEAAMPIYPPGPGADWAAELPTAPAAPLAAAAGPVQTPPVQSAATPVLGTSAAAVVDPTGQGAAATLGGGVTKQALPPTQAQAAPPVVPPAAAAVTPPVQPAVAPVAAQTPPVAPAAPGPIDPVAQIAALAKNAADEDATWEVINFAKQQGATDAQITAGLRQAGLTDNDFGSLGFKPFAEPVEVEATTTPTEPPAPVLAPEKGIPATIQPAVEKVSTESTPAAKAVVQILDKVFDPAKPKSMDVTTSSLTNFLGGASAKRTAQSVSHLVNALTQKAEGGKYRVLKPGVDVEKALATSKGLFGPGQAPVLDAAFARIMAEGQPKAEVQPSVTKAEAVPVAEKPEGIDPEALRASILEGVDLNGDPNAPALVNARLRLRSLSPAEVEALAGLYPDKPLKGSRSVASQSLARRLGLTTEKESFRADGTVLRAVPKAAPVLPAVPVEPPVPKAIPAKPAKTETAPSVEAPTEPKPKVKERGYTKQQLERRDFLRETNNLYKKVAAETEKQLETAAAKAFKDPSLENRQTRDRLENKLLVVRKEMEDISAELQQMGFAAEATPTSRSPMEVGEPLPEGAAVVEDFTAKTSTGEVVSGKAKESSPAKTQYLKKVNQDDPADVALANAIWDQSNSQQFRYKADKLGLDLANLDADVTASLLSSLHTAIKGSPEYAARGATELDSVVGQAMNSVAGASKLKTALKASKQKSLKRWLAETFFNQALGRKVISQGKSVDEAGGRLGRELTAEDVALSELINGIDPSGDARIAKINDVLSRTKQPAYVLEALQQLESEVAASRSGKLSGSANLSRVTAFMQANKIEGTLRAFLQKVAEAQAAIERAFSADQATRVKLVYDGQKDSNDLIRGRAEQLGQTLDTMIKGEEFDYLDLWRQAVRVTSDAESVSEYLKGAGKSKELKARLDSLGILSQIEKLTGAAKAVVATAKPGNLETRLKNLTWTGDKKSLQRTLRSALEELNPEGREADLPLPDGFEAGRAAKVEGKSQAALNRASLANDLWSHFAKENVKVSAITRAMSLKDPLEVLGKQISGVRKPAGVPIRVFKQHPEDTTKLVLSLDSSTSRPSTAEGREVKLEETPTEGFVPKEGLPRLEEATVTPNLPKLLGDFASKLHQTGSDRFLVSADLPAAVAKTLDNPATWDGLPIKAERLEALDSQDRVGYRLVPNDQGAESSFIFAPEKAAAKEPLKVAKTTKLVSKKQWEAEQAAKAKGEIPPSPKGESVKPPESFMAKRAAEAKLAKEASAAGFLNVRDYLASRGGGTASAPRPTKAGKPAYQAEKVGRSVAEWNKFLNEGTVPKIEKATVEAAFPGRAVQEGTNSFSVQLPNGSTIFIHKTGFIAIDPEALKRGYGPDANPDEYLATGSFKTLGPDGLIKIVKGEALPEEVGHAMWSLGLTNRQRDLLFKKYGDEETAVKAWVEWHKDFKAEKDPTGLFAHVTRFFRDLYRKFRPTVDSTFKQMSSGKIWEQRADKIESGAKYSAVPKTQEEFDAELIEHEYTQAINAASDELARVLPGKVPKYLEPANFKGEQLKAALDDLSQLGPTAPSKPGGGKGVLDLGFNSFRNLLDDDTMRHAKLLASIAKKVKSGYRYSEKPEMRTVIDSVLKSVGRIDPVEMTNRVTALLNKEGKTHDIEKGLAYIQRLNNTMYQQGRVFASKALEAREKLLGLRNPDGSVKPGVSQEAHAAAQTAYDLAVQQGMTHHIASFITQNADSGAGSLLGRLLRQRSITRDMLDPAGVAKGRLLGALKGIAGHGNAALAELAHKKFLEEADTSGIVALAEAASKKDWLAKLLQYIKNGMLGPSSQTSNIAGNTIQMGARLAEDNVAHHVVNKMLDAFASATGRESIKDRKFLKPASELLWEASKDGWRLGKKQLAEDLSSVFGLRRLKTLPHEAIDVAEFPHQMGAIEGKKGEFISIPGKLMGTMDRFFQAKIRTREMMIEAYGQAVKDGHTGEALLAESRKNYKTLADALDMTNPNFETSMNTPWVGAALEKVVKQVAENTFQASLHGTMFEGMEKILQKHRGLQFIIPFYRTPANIFLQTLKRTPAGFFMKGTGKDGALMSRDIAKPLVGTSLMMLFYSLAETGDLTGGGSIDPEMRENQKQTGWLPYSVLMGDQWVTYNRLEPVSSLVGIAADMHEAVRRGDINNASSLLSRGLQIVQNNLTNKTFLSGVSNFMTAYSDPERYGDRLAKGLTGMLVPNMLGAIPVGSLARAADPVYRKTTALTEPIAKIPGMSESFPAQATSMGEDRQRPGSFLSRLAFPGQISEVRHDKGASVAEELDRIGAKIRPPRMNERIYGANVEYTPYEFQLIKKAHKDATSEVYARLKSGGLRTYPDNEDDPRYIPGQKTKVQVIRDIYEKHRGKAKAQISPYLQRRARGLLKQRQEEARNAG